MKFNIKKEDSCKSGVYIIYSTDTNDSYIGSTFSFKERYIRHICSIKRKETRTKLNRFINEFGFNNLCMDVLLFCPKEEMKIKEYELIQLHKPTLNVHKKQKTKHKIFISDDIKYGGKNYWLGRKHSEETKKIISDIMPKKPVRMLDLNNNIIKDFISIRSITREYGFAPSHICSCCKGKSKTAYGFKFEYIND